MVRWCSTGVRRPERRGRSMHGSACSYRKWRLTMVDCCEDTGTTATADSETVRNCTRFSEYSEQTYRPYTRSVATQRAALCGTRVMRCRRGFVTEMFEMRTYRKCLRNVLSNCPFFINRAGKSVRHSSSHCVTLALVSKLPLCNPLLLSRRARPYFYYLVSLI